MRLHLPRTAPLAVFVFIVVASLVSTAPAARAEPWFGFGENRAEDRYADGDLDMEDLVGTRLGRGGVGATDVRARSWVSLVGFTGVYPNGQSVSGAMAVLGLALDKVAAGPMHRVADRPDPPAPPPSPTPTPAASLPKPAPPPPPPPPRMALTPLLARSAVAAAWRAAGLGVDDARIDAMVSRARMSAALPEMRLRVLKLVDDNGKSDASTDQTRYYDATGASLWLEARLTWRLDRLLYADDEPTLERVRLERNDARARVGARVLDALVQWQRARLDESTAPEQSKLRALEAEIVLDVLTGGWFTASQMR